MRLQAEGAYLRECGNGAEVVVDVKHGGVQQGVNVLETLEPGLEAPSALCLQLSQLLLRQSGQRRRRRRHCRHWRRREELTQNSSLQSSVSVGAVAAECVYRRLTIHFS